MPHADTEETQDTVDETTRDNNRLSEFDLEFVDWDHIEAFAKALRQNPDKDGPEQPEHIQAVTDWSPIHEKVKKKRNGTSRGRNSKRKDLHAGSQGFSYTLLRYPLMFFIGSIISLELWLYFWIRQTVNLWEYFFSWRGGRRRLRDALRSAPTYTAWVQAAKALDRYLKNDEWKAEDAYGYYDYNLVRKVVKSLKTLRSNLEIFEHGSSSRAARSQSITNAASSQGDRPDSPMEDIRPLYTPDLQAGPSAPMSGATSYFGNINSPSEVALMLEEVLKASLKSNFAGIENSRLYSHSYFGTKKLIETYVEVATESIRAVLETEYLPLQEKHAFFKNVYKNYGRSALCLSGGGSLGYYHYGVIRALIEQNMLPSVITGTSAGGLMAALTCTRTDTELREILVPRLHTQLTACSDPMTTQIKRFFKEGARFDAVDWAIKAMWATRGSLTFKEAYERTGRILNVSVIPYDPHSPPKLLNYVTAPDCVIWSAIIASAAVPGILNPVVLMQKTRDGRVVPYNYGHKWKDGSLRTDIPLQALHNQFNVNYTIVSQVNPHVHLFFYANKGVPGRPVVHRRGGWRGGFIASSIEQFLKLDLYKWLKVLRDLELLPRFMDQDWSWIWLQKFDGNVTIWPKSCLWDFTHVLTDPDYNRMVRYLRVGSSQTWSKLHMISNRMRIEREILRGRDKIKADVRRERERVLKMMERREVSAAERDRLRLEELILSSDPDELPMPSEDASFLRKRALKRTGRLERSAIDERKRQRFREQFMDNGPALQGDEAEDTAHTLGRFTPTDESSIDTADELEDKPEDVQGHLRQRRLINEEEVTAD
ncbi:hypothetical protein BZG36_03693 [Bifiguratus adelaidae]|uniref:Patatin-like phospholipase domain-containing protein n=1 Tax=Bifiguratus adelaidae TaxID=1938954 RepID=A0A261XZ03_9FUNG|nr:hypothetical protein BZG36_03693 [Bifiguratus adelaidae]